MSERKEGRLVKQGRKRRPAVCAIPEMAEQVTSARAYLSLEEPSEPYVTAKIDIILWKRTLS